MKRSLRNEILAKRKAQPAAEQKGKSLRIAQKLLGLDEFLGAGVVAAYLPVNGEVDTAGIIEAARKAGKDVCVPVVREGGAMCLVLYGESDELGRGKYGIPEPLEKPERRHVDMVIVPGVVFDKFGHRIGMGGGYYDRYLKDKECVNVGICFDFQLVEKIPNETHDVPMDIVVTEREIIRIEK
ncbi:5-formyltetrahydrofolate cyclo-ligase [Candidatus Micrarchaeota archaeon]|nr:5-formyltetrahydrofolate cyclo-ligase [Candidatus Micrarchaeota archaeon]